MNVTLTLAFPRPDGTEEVRTGVPARIVAVNKAENTATIEFQDSLTELPLDPVTLARWENEQGDKIYKAMQLIKELGAAEPDCILVPNPDGLTDEELNKTINERLVKQIEEQNDRVLRGESGAYIGL